MKLTRKRTKSEMRATRIKVGIVLAVILAYIGYWFVAPTPIQVPTVASSPSNPELLIISMQNPSLKVVTGAIISIQTEVDIANPRNSSEDSILASVPETYNFILLPFLPQTFDIPMNSHVVGNGTQYDVNFKVNGGSIQTITVTLY